jgi:GNAT superfamily N-acetyltransferase
MIVLADDGQIEEMARLWQICFGDDMSYIRNFFSRRFKSSGALVYLSDRKAAAMLFTLPAALRLNGADEPTQYIYAVCTHPDYRKRGIMGELMEAAWEYALKRGERFSVLLPASDGLYVYYGRMGYLEYFKRRRIEGAFAVRDYADDCAFVDCNFADCNFAVRNSDGGFSFDDDSAPGQIHRIRRSLFGEREGTLLWDEPAVAYAISALEVYGGRVRRFEHEGRQGYLMGYVDKDKDIAVVQELAADPELWPWAARAAAECFPAASVQWSLPADLDPAGTPDRFAGRVTVAAETVERWGMIRPLDGGAARVLAQSRARIGGRLPYLGMALD